MGTLLVGREDEVATVRTSLVASPSPAGVVVYGEAGVGKTTLVRAALNGWDVREGGALATLAWSSYLALRRAFGDLPPQIWSGDPAYVAEQVRRALGDDILHIEDLQWADPVTRDVISMLAGRCRLVVTIRRGDPAAAEALALFDATALLRLDLEPLSVDDATALARQLRPRLTSQELASLVDRSGGDPLLLEELADTGADIATLHRAVLARCRHLSETQLDDLALLALAGRPLAGTDLDDLVGLVESGIVTDVDGTAVIRHALIGEVIDDLLTEERAGRSHRRLAELLTHPGERARHLLAIGDRTAAHAAANLAVAQADTPGERIAHLETAALCLDPIAGAELRLRAAEEATEVDMVDAATTLLDGVPERPDLAFRISRQRFYWAMHRGDAEALAAATETTAGLARPGTAEEVLALMDQSFSILATTGTAEGLANALALAEQAVTVSDQADAERSAALKALADALWLSGDPRWRDAMPAALDQARREGNVAREWRIANNWISALQTHGPLSDGLALAEQMITRYDELRLVSIRRNFEFRRINLLGNLGDFAAVLDHGRELLTATGMASVMSVDLHCCVAEAELLTGRIEEGIARLGEEPAVSTERGRVEVHRLLAEMYYASDRPELAAAELAHWDAYDIGAMHHIQVAPLRAWLARTLDLPPPERPSDLPDEGMFAGVAPELDGIDALRAGAPATAARHFATASERYRGRYADRQLTCQWAHGEALRLSEDPGAHAALSAVEAEATARGMVRLRVRCERSLRLLGVHRSAPLVRSADSPLTEREHEVAGLAAQGLTDTEIGARLGIQRRTVQTLLANARAKLGAENRAHLIRLVTEASR